MTQFFFFRTNCIRGVPLEILSNNARIRDRTISFLQVVWVGDVCLELLKDVISIQM